MAAVELNKVTVEFHPRPAMMRRPPGLDISQHFAAHGGAIARGAMILFREASAP